ncbi:reductive dehalogenase [bacterium]|nr:reductive dehalogenase [bacterium]
MVPIILFLSWSLFVLLISMSLAFIITSIHEKRFRPVFKILAILPGIFFYGLLLYISFPYKYIILEIILIFTFAGSLIFFFIPVGRRNNIKIVGSQEKVDERDALFHRFYRIKPGMEEFDKYYKMHPENKEIDNEVRELPNLNEPGSISYNKMTSPFQQAAFDILDTFNKQVDFWPPVKTDIKVAASAKEFTKRIKGFARYLGADLVGITPLNQAYVYSNIGRSPGEWGEEITLNHPNAIAIAVKMDFDMMRFAPHHIVTTETAFKYFEAAKISAIVARYIQLLGYSARANLDGNYRVMCPPIAADAGLGELGRLGLLITPKFGPRVRIAVVTTDMPLEFDKPISFGVQDFCTFCKKCAVNCPSGSIDKGDKKVYRGVEKWQSNQITCYKFWRMQGSDCSICVNVCPFSHPSTFLHNIIRWGIKRNWFFRRFALIADDFFYGRRPVNQAPFPSWHKPA